MKKRQTTHSSEEKLPDSIGKPSIDKKKRNREIRPLPYEIQVQRYHVAGHERQMRPDNMENALSSFRSFRTHLQICLILSWIPKRKKRPKLLRPTGGPRSCDQP